MEISNLSIKVLPWVLPWLLFVVLTCVVPVIRVVVEGTDSQHRAEVLLALAAVIRAILWPWPSWACSARPGRRSRREPFGA